MTFTYKIKSEIYRSKEVSGPRRAAQAYGLLLGLANTLGRRPSAWSLRISG